MSLTGLPLILLTGTLAVLVAAATVRGWRRPAIRIAGLILTEALIVAGAGLIANRSAGFYPSWRALGGAPDATVPTPVAPGRLDGALGGRGAVLGWAPPEAAGWRLAVRPQLVIPPDYPARPERTFPVVVALVGAPDAASLRRTAASAPGVLTLILRPTAGTTATALAALPGALARDVRSAGAPAVLATPRWAPLAAAWSGRPAVSGFAEAVRALPEPLAAPLRLPS
ncbi:hypothetical protein [Actinoplanes teichomyceticus]|uniref:Uncharacterized protein n=1 Tax=Actinoplanes teichomyceticus TaxID=1867 RepID=A0A561VLI5_ACTTI|nr:hypothetical protein [Actinoplanes teichomyceticus]TWG12475.1 hypothetical protein FHX34_105342 [Actinoplanes teichomyceticus]GIF13840.1 hypothetical protein Ate01nite_38720 [Actinoplanes teichomyceticus]